MEIDGSLYRYAEYIPWGAKVIFEEDNGKTEAIIEEYAAEHRTQLRCNPDHTFEFPKSRADGTPAIRLAAFLYAHYNGIPIEEVRKFRVHHKYDKFLDDARMIEDCRKSNLQWTGVPTLDSKYKSFISVGNKCFGMVLHSYGITDYFTDYPDLFEILATSSNFTLFVNGAGRTQARLMPCQEKRQSPYVSWIAYAFYQGLLTRDNFREFLTEHPNCGEGYCIDHVNSNVHDNRKTNLMRIACGTNQSKKHLSDMFPAGYHANYAVTDSGECLIEYTFPNVCDGRITTQYIRCKTPEALSNWIDTQFGRKGIIVKPLKYIHRAAQGEIITTQTPRALQETEKRGRDILADIDAADRLLFLYKANSKAFFDWKEIKESYSMEAFNAELETIVFQLAGVRALPPQ